MKLNEVNNLQFYTFDSFEKTGLVKHCFTTRIGGVSAGCYSTLNMGFHKGDSDENVLENFKRVCDALKIEAGNLVFSDQVHLTEIYNAGKNDVGKGIFCESDIKNIDGLMTNETEVALTTFYADCVPLYFLDVTNKVIALSHAGWKGTVGKIAAVTVDKMKNDYNSRLEDILVGIGPSIGQCCFEVEIPVVNEFELKIPYSDAFIKKSEVNQDKYYIDLWGVNGEILLEAGILPTNIEIAEICTKCNGEMFYSHRNMGTKRGSMAAIMQLC